MPSEPQWIPAILQVPNILSMGDVNTSVCEQKYRTQIWPGIEPRVHLNESPVSYSGTAGCLKLKTSMRYVRFHRETRITFEEDSFLGCCAVLSGRTLQTFQRWLLPPLSGRWVIAAVRTWNFTIKQHCQYLVVSVWTFYSLFLLYVLALCRPWHRRIHYLMCNLMTWWITLHGIYSKTAGVFGDMLPFYHDADLCKQRCGPEYQINVNSTCEGKTEVVVHLLSNMVVKLMYGLLTSSVTQAI